MGISIFYTSLIVKIISVNMKNDTIVFMAISPFISMQVKLERDIRAGSLGSFLIF